ncbi:hypothetical protein [Kordiimonas sp.]|uniref:hypothetical protein n=1 Tax=Kordiimonas sp. TaxID=1970157 RepID=UPI003A8EEE1F
MNGVNNLVIALMTGALVTLGAGAHEETPHEIFLARALSDAEAINGQRNNYVGFLDYSGGEFNIYTSKEALKIGNVYESAHLSLNITSSRIWENISRCDKSLVSVHGKIQIVLPKDDKSIKYPVAQIVEISRISKLEPPTSCIE